MARLETEDGDDLEKTLAASGLEAVLVVDAAGRVRVENRALPEKPAKGKKADTGSPPA